MVTAACNAPRDASAFRANPLAFKAGCVESMGDRFRRIPARNCTRNGVCMMDADDRLFIVLAETKPKTHAHGAHA